MGNKVTTKEEIINRIVNERDKLSFANFFAPYAHMKTMPYK